MPPYVLRSMKKSESKNETKRTGPTIRRAKSESEGAAAGVSEKEARRAAILWAEGRESVNTLLYRAKNLMKNAVSPFVVAMLC